MRVPMTNLAAQYETNKAAMHAAFSRVMGRATYIRGPELARFEENFAAYIGVEHAVGVGCGGDALYLALRALDIGPGDEVIVPTYTYVATAFAVSRVRGTPVFVDCDSTYGIDPDQVAAAITPRTKVVIPVHMAGQPVNMGPVRAAIAGAGRWGPIMCIEDAAQAAGATYNGRRCGSLSIMGCFSFYPSKNLGACGDGGCVTTNDDDLVARMRILRDYGQDRKYHHVEIGVNSLLDGLQAAILAIKLRRLDAWNQKRRDLAALYKSLLDECPAVSGYQKHVPGATHVYHLFSIETPVRDALQKFLAEREIQTAIHYPTPVHAQPAYAHMQDGRAFPEAYRLSTTTLSLPMCPFTTQAQVEYVCRSIWEFARR